MKILVYHPELGIYIEESEEENIYDAVLNLTPKYLEGNCVNIDFKKVINLHDENYFSNKKITSMKKAISKGEHIFEGQLPNIKILRSKQGDILFDGHHTLLAYLLEGKLYKEIPYILIEVEGKEKQPFLEHQNSIDDWKEVVIDWNLPPNEQIVKRIRRNIGEVLENLQFV